jgi:hypothetical protein
MEREEGLHPLRHPLFAPGDVEFLSVGAAKGRRLSRFLFTAGKRNS